MTTVATAIGYAGLGGAFLSAAMIIWHAVCLAGLGQIGLLTNSFRFLDRKRHPAVARPHVGAMIRWFAILAGCFVLFGIGASAGTL